MKSWILFLCCMLLPFGISSQTLKVRVVDSSGSSIPNATVYIRELALGITADDNGDFQTSLNQGNYTCEFSSLGYERKITSITVDKPSVSVIVKMEKKTYALKEVVVSANREDPANAIMRKAISMAPFYLHQVKKYNAGVYLKGTIKVEKMPAIVRIKVSNQELKNIKNKLFLIESQNEVMFTAPNKYEQKVVAFSSTLPTDMKAGDAMQVMTANIYDPNVFGKISPLAPGAFSFYKFIFEGVETEGDHLINKIRVQPKKKNARLVSGWLYIIENSWNIQRADLSSTEFGMTTRFKAAFNEVKPAVFLPTSYDINMNVDIMGFKASGKYYSSVRYKDVLVNEARRTTAIQKEKEKITPVAPKKSITKPKQQIKKQQQAQKQLEDLSAKENLSNREAYKLAKLMQEASEPEEEKMKRQSLELLDTESPIKITVDSLADLRDSLYWNEVRNLPLLPDEVHSYEIKDSLTLVNDSLQRRDSLSNRTVGYWAGKLLMGETIRFSKKFRIGYSGLLRAVPEYNFVDGFRIGQRISFGIEFDSTKSLAIAPSVYYTTARKAVDWNIAATFNYSPMRDGVLKVSGGNTVADFNGSNGTLRLINSISSLLFAENPITFYQKRFVEIMNKIDVSNGLILTTGMQYEKRNSLMNNTSYSFFGEQPKSNIPNGQGQYMPDNTATKAVLKLEYTPRYHYRSYRGKKNYIYSLYPTFTLNFEKGIATNESNTASYNKLEFEIRQFIKVNAFDNISYTLNAGKFLTSKRVFFPDYKHFNTNELFVTANSLENSFSLLDNYAWSSNQQWLQGHFNYTSDYLLIKRLPFLQNYLFNEALHVRTLWIPSRNYTEVGYSIGFSGVARAGIFAGFNKGKYDAVGITISIPLFK